ncbi:hypothetical protein FIBSPDRAFT_871806 [Athelia psychrophila]|uniref:Uncharacterized protein n=1 Tax=Athelia psychrophila TaxID=1759441 RepID=A0A166A1X4_9AGAM|nr:hypothetical protein FIBSPDRAFT_871806 [Fibularhizoctonia sp. CBS 109695]
MRHPHLSSCRTHAHTRTFVFTRLSQARARASRVPALSCHDSRMLLVAFAPATASPAASAVAHAQALSARMRCNMWPVPTFCTLPYVPTLCCPTVVPSRTPLYQ